MLVLSGVVFAADGANGWAWTKKADVMTDEVQYTFMKMTVDGDGPAIMLIYVPTTKQWYWGLISHDSWTDEDTLDVTYRLGKDPAKKEFFIAEGGRFYTTIKDIVKFVTYPAIILRPRTGEQDQYDMTGLAKTIKMAGLNLQ
jgi:hypothetical protein